MGLRNTGLFGSYMSGTRTFAAFRPEFHPNAPYQAGYGDLPLSSFVLSGQFLPMFLVLVRPLAVRSAVGTQAGQGLTQGAHLTTADMYKYSIYHSMISIDFPSENCWATPRASQRAITVPLLGI